MAILFLELDDEITTAVGRLRAAADRTVALVLPAGSRIASSRINFRLLAREAEGLGTELAIVAPEATTRALASAAGLPTYSTVDRYEAAVAGGGGAGAEPADGEPELAPAPTSGGRAGIDRAGFGAADTAPTVVGMRAVEAPPSGPLPVVRSARGPARPALSLPRIGVSPLLVALVALLVLGAGTVAGVYFVLPEAHVAITPRVESFGPLVIQVTADPDVTASDPSAGVVPASWVETTVDANDTFNATGIKVTETAAIGSVTFSWYGNQTSATVPSGSVIKTKKGVAFRTTKAVVVPKAAPPPSNQPGTASVGIEAVDPGAAGNVAANTITVIPKGFSPSLLKVTNPQATTGGTHTEAKVVTQSDYDAAVTALTKQLRQSFDEWLASGPAGTGGLLVQQDSAALDAATFDVAAADAVGTAVDTFDLSGESAGRVLTVDPKALTKIGTDRFPATVPAGYTVAGPITVATKQIDSADPAKPRFDVTATGRAYRALDTAALKSLILGKPIDQARALLRSYGDATVTLTPDWFGTIPQLDWRVSVETRVPAQGS